MFVHESLAAHFTLKSTTLPIANLVYFYRDVWVEGSGIRAGSNFIIKIKKTTLPVHQSTKLNYHRISHFTVYTYIVAVL